MVTRYDGTCHFCGTATTAGTDWAFLDGAGKFQGCCGSCATSTSYRIANIANAIGAVQDDLTEAQLAMLPDVPTNLAEAIQGQLTEAEMAIVTVEMMALHHAVTAALRVEDARIVALRHVTPNGSFEQSFIPSVISQYETKGTLSDKQWGIVEKALAKRAEGVERKGQTNRYGGKCANCEFYVNPGQGLYSGGVVSHVTCPTFEEWCVETYGALPGSPELREIAQRHANLTHNCIFCGLELEHPDSDPRQGGVGYGPVCAVKYGLPHGGSGARKAGQTLRKQRADMNALGMHFDPRDGNRACECGRSHTADEHEAVVQAEYRRNHNADVDGRY